MPLLNTMYQTMHQRIDDFYKNASIFKTNRFFVGFWGDYVNQAVRYMEAHSGIDPKTGNEKRGKGFATHIDSFNRWKAKHTNKNVYDGKVTYEVELKWTCSSVTIPHLKPTLDNGGFVIDAYKPIDYPLITGYGGKGTVTLSVVEDRDLNMYQFFNALQNQFFGMPDEGSRGSYADPRMMTPRSSFQKMGMYIAVVQEEFLSTSQESVVVDAMNQVKAENGTVRQDILDDVPVQIFEFNSAVITGISDTVLDHEQRGAPLKYTITFSVPNTFQQAYKQGFRGLRNSTTDPNYTESTESLLDTTSTDKTGAKYSYRGMYGDKGYNTNHDQASAFEDDRSIDTFTK